MKIFLWLYLAVFPYIISYENILTYHNVIMGFNPENCKNHAAVNTIIMAVKKRICYKERLKTHDPATIKSIIEGRMNVEKYLEGKKG